MKKLMHKQHLTEAFKRLRQSGLTLRGSKCQIGVTQVSYLGHVFSAAGMAPDNSKVQAVRNWPRPNDVTAVKQFLGLASYYRRYILNFADIARPLHMLTQKNNMYVWSNACDHACVPNAEEQVDGSTYPSVPNIVVRKKLRKH